MNTAYLTEKMNQNFSEKVQCLENHEKRILSIENEE